MTFFGATLLSAIATVVLAVLAIVTAGYARRAFPKQSREVGILLEQSEHDKADRRMAQAARVFLAADPDAVQQPGCIGLLVQSVRAQEPPAAPE